MWIQILDHGVPDTVFDSLYALQIQLSMLLIGGKALPGTLDIT